LCVYKNKVVTYVHIRNVLVTLGHIGIKFNAVSLSVVQELHVGLFDIRTYTPISLVWACSVSVVCCAFHCRYGYRGEGVRTAVQNQFMMQQASEDFDKMTAGECWKMPHKVWLCKFFLYICWKAWGKKLSIVISIFACL